jgi:predicted ATP-dependent serine protease
VVEIIITRNQIIRQLRSFKNRFITCDKLNEQLEMTKYDENGLNEKVVVFHDNVIYQCDLSNIRKKMKENEDINHEFAPNLANVNNNSPLNNGNN